MNVQKDTRFFRGSELTDLLIESGHRCAHPFCDYPYLSLEAHHMIQYSRGGFTAKPNGIVLCTRCHRMVHEGMVPLPFQLLIKASLQTASGALLPITTVSVEALSQKANAIRDDPELQASEKFHLLNDILIAGNFFPSESSRFSTFLSAIAAKISVLNDGVSPLRSSLDRMLLSMKDRRRWARVLAANAIWYAQHINDTWLALYFMHSRAVGFNAGNDFQRAVTAFKRAINYLDNMAVASDRVSDASQLRARLIREMAVCRAKVAQHSRLATREVVDSLNQANAIGEPQGIFDALNRCVEAFAYEEEADTAEAYLGKLLSSWDLISDHSRAIAMKMHAKVLIIQNRMTEAAALIQKGLGFSLAHRFNQQIYHFRRLQWSAERKDADRRSIIIT